MPRSTTEPRLPAGPVISRRTLGRAAVWTAPVVAGVVLAPSASASPATGGGGTGGGGTGGGGVTTFAASITHSCLNGQQGVSYELKVTSGTFGIGDTITLTSSATTISSLGLPTAVSVAAGTLGLAVTTYTPVARDVTVPRGFLVTTSGQTVTITLGTAAPVTTGGTITVEVKPPVLSGNTSQIVGSVLTLSAAGATNSAVFSRYRVAPAVGPTLNGTVCA